jgi:hypothetical protein
LVTATGALTARAGQALRYPVAGVQLADRGYAFRCRALSSLIARESSPRRSCACQSQSRPHGPQRSPRYPPARPTQLTSSRVTWSGSRRPPARSGRETAAGGPQRRAPGAKDRGRCERPTGSRSSGSRVTSTNARRVAGVGGGRAGAAGEGQDRRLRVGGSLAESRRENEQDRGQYPAATRVPDSAGFRISTSLQGAASGCRVAGSPDRAEGWPKQCRTNGADRARRLSALSRSVRYRRRSEVYAGRHRVLVADRQAPGTR